MARVGRLRTRWAGALVNASTASQDAVAMLTVALTADAEDELTVLARDLLGKGRQEELVVAMATLTRSVCIAAATLVCVVDEGLTDEQAAQLDGEQVLAVALRIAGCYGRSAATPTYADEEERR